MQIVPLQAIPNQSITLQIDNNFYELTIKTTRGITAVSITINNIVVVSSARAVAGEFIIQSKYLQNGNFAFYTPNNYLPDYTLFGTTQQLLYYSPSEL